MFILNPGGSQPGLPIRPSERERGVNRISDKRASKTTILILLSSVVLFLDQLTKYLASLYLLGRGPVKLVAGLLDLTYVRNKGAAFGLLAEAPASLRIPFFLSITLAAFYLLWRFFRHIPEGATLTTVAISLIFSGALGNLIDRTRQGEVVDFLDLYFRAYHWPAFNLADLSITTGVILLVVHFLKRPHSSPRE